MFVTHVFHDGMLKVDSVDQEGFHSYQSITVQGLQTLINNKLVHLPFFKGKKISSNTIREYLLAGNPHPAWLFPECFSSEPPEAALTYEWRLDFDDIFSYLNSNQISKCARKWNASVPGDISKLLIWIDVLFIDQVDVLIMCAAVQVFQGLSKDH